MCVRRNVIRVIVLNIEIFTGVATLQGRDLVSGGDGRPETPPVPWFPPRSAGEAGRVPGPGTNRTLDAETHAASSPPRVYLEVETVNRSVFFSSTVCVCAVGEKTETFYRTLRGCMLLFTFAIVLQIQVRSVENIKALLR